MTADYISDAARDLIDQFGVNHRINSKTPFRYEHMVPKNEYILKPLKAKAAKGTLTKKHVKDLLEKYYYVACITIEEDSKLSKTSMPKKWDKQDIKARYTTAGIELKENTIVEELLKEAEDNI